MYCKQEGKSLLFVFVLAYLKCLFVGAVSFEVTRQAEDKFQNPTVSKCDHLGGDFCLRRDSKCDWSPGCCSCLCEYSKSTFDTTSLKCRKNVDFRAGCKLLFKKVYPEQPIKLLVLSQKGKENVLWDGLNDKKVSCQITSIVFLHNRAVAKTRFLKVGRVKKEKNSPTEIEIKWENNVPATYHGRVFKVHMKCKAGSQEPTGCFVFKSSGKITVHLLPTSSTAIFLPSSFVQSSSHIVPKISPTSTLPLEPEILESTPMVSASPILIPSVLKPGNTLAEQPLVTVQRKTMEKEAQTPTMIIVSPSSSTIAESSKYYAKPGEISGGGKSSKAVVISVSVVAAILVVVAILLLILWSRKKATKSSKQKENNRSKGGVKRGATANPDNTITLNDIEHIYAEANCVGNSRCGNDNPVNYDYADSNANDHYTSLDKSICENNPHYQSLITTATGNLVPHGNIPAQSNGGNGQSAVSESIYHDLTEEEGIDAPVPVIYSVLDDVPTQSRTNYNAQDQATSSGLEQNEQIYSVLQEDKKEAESDYVLVLPSENTEYERPIDQPRR